MTFSSFIALAYHLLAATALLVVAIITRKKIGGLGPFFIGAIAILDITVSILYRVLMAALDATSSNERFLIVDAISMIFTIAASIFAVIAFVLMRNPPATS